MGRIVVPVILFFGVLIFSILEPEGGTSTFAAENSENCALCHYDSKSVLGEKHPEVEITGIRGCLACHEPAAVSGKAEPNPFSAKLHMAHVNEEVVLECVDCHTWTEGKSLGLPGLDISFGELSGPGMKSLEEIFTSWSTSSFADRLHGKAHVTCSGCHGESLPDRGAMVQDERCLACHGPMSKLIERTIYEGFPGRNPHDSHLGPLDCSVCHTIHSTSRSYCLECHSDFKMKIPGG